MKNKLLLFSVFIFLGIHISYATPTADTARFSSDAPKCKSDSVKFTDASIIVPGDAITSRLWNFGDPGSSNTSTFQNPSHLYSAGGVFSVKLVNNYSSGYKDSITISVGIQSLVIISAGSDYHSCKNNLTVQMHGSVSNAGSEIWHGPRGLGSNTSAFSPQPSLNPIYTPTAAAKASGTDTVVITSVSPGFCQNVSDTSIIFFANGPTVYVGPDIFVCKDTLSIPVSATNISGATGGIWKTTGGGHFADTLQISTHYFPSVSDTAAGSVIIYLKTIGNGICLATSDSLKITFTPTPTVVIKTSSSSCSGRPIILDVNASTMAGVWSSFGTGTFPNNTVLNGYYFPSTSDDNAGKVTLKFTSTNNGGCHSVFDTLAVIIKPSPTAAYTSIMQCALVPIQFTDASIPANSTVNWDFGDGAISTSQNPSHTYAFGGPYHVSLNVISTNGCKDTVSKLINVYRLPIADFTANGLCLNAGTIFTNVSNVTGATITSSHWNFGDLTTSNLTSPTHFFTSSGSEIVKLVVQSSQGCFDSITHSIPVEAGPVAAFTVSDATANINQAITFTDLSTVASPETINGWSWDFGDLSAKDTLQFPSSHIYTVGGLYNICLTATDVGGCKDAKCQQEIVTTHPAGPSGFSPNNDGQNDVFYVYGGPFKTLDFRIYNSWGELIFESYKQSDGWDGKRNGIDQPIGVYVYTVVGITEDDNEYKLSGDVTLLR